MLSWKTLTIASDGSHHVDQGAEVYAERFDEVQSFHDPGLAPVCRAGQAWHIRPNGRAAYAHRFRRTFGFYEGLAAVFADDGWHHIDTSGQDSYPERYEWCGNFQGGRCTARIVGGGYFHLLPGGLRSYPAVWRYAGDYKAGSCVVQNDDGYSTHIDTSGNLLHGLWFFDLDVFHKGFARARDDSGWTHVNQYGTPVYARRFAAVEPFYNGQARVERFDGGLEIIDERGQTLVELRPAPRPHVS